MTTERVVADAEDVALAVRDLTDEVRRVAKTLGLLAMIQIAVAVKGLSKAEAEELRKAMLSIAE